MNIKNCPKKLYVLGNEKILKNFCIAIVGSRRSTDYGLRKAKELARELSNIGITIVSGLAIGIDTEVHKYSMKEIGKTIAVLGSGFKEIYPKENINLFNEILLNDGCIISEYDVNECAMPKNFPIRNRIISGLSVGTVVVEANKKSGSNITARYTMEQDKKLFCIPNSVEIKQAEGTNNLIRKGAILTRDYKDILEEYLLNYKVEKENIKKENIIKVPKEYKEIYEIIGNIPININEIYRVLKIKNISYLNQLLYMMELEGYVKKLPGNNYMRG